MIGDSLLVVGGDDDDDDDDLDHHPSCLNQNKALLVRMVDVPLSYPETWKLAATLLMEEILHQLVSSLSRYLAGFYTSQVVRRISSINSTCNERCWVRAPQQFCTYHINEFN